MCRRRGGPGSRHRREVRRRGRRATAARGDGRSRGRSSSLGSSCYAARRDDRRAERPRWGPGADRVAPAPRGAVAAVRGRSPRAPRRSAASVTGAPVWSPSALVASARAGWSSSPRGRLRLGDAGVALGRLAVAASPPAPVGRVAAARAAVRAPRLDRPATPWRRRDVAGRRASSRPRTPPRCGGAPGGPEDSRLPRAGAVEAGARRPGPRPPLAGRRRRHDRRTRRPRRRRSPRPSRPSRARASPPGAGDQLARPRGDVDASAAGGREPGRRAGAAARAAGGGAARTSGPRAVARAGARRPGAARAARPPRPASGPRPRSAAAPVALALRAAPRAPPACRARPRGARRARAGPRRSPSSVARSSS